MSSEVRVIGDVELIGSLAMTQNPVEFPTNPKLNTIVVKDGTPWIYSRIGSFNTWRPLINLPSYHIHTQGLAATSWVVSHNLGTQYFVYVIYDESGNVMNPMRIVPSQDGMSVTVNFAVEVAGTMVLFAAAAGIGTGQTDNVYAGVISGVKTLMASRYYFVDSGAELTLPSSPSIGDKIVLFDYQSSSTFTPITVSGGSNMINGVSNAQVSLDIPGYEATFVYSGALGWKVF